MLRRPTPRHNRGRIHVPSGSSPHPALAHGNAIAVWEMDDPGVELNGSDVSKVPNRIDPGAYDLIQATASRQPAYEATGWNGTSPSMLFDGAGTLLSSADVATLLSGTDVSWGAVVAWEGVTSTAYDGIVSLSGTDYHWIGARDSNLVLVQRFKSSGGNKTDTYGQTFAQRNVMGYSFVGGVDQMRVNNSAIFSGGDRDAGGSVTFTSFDVGAFSISSSFANIRIGAIWLYSSLTDMAGAITAMATKWPHA